MKMKRNDILIILTALILSYGVELKAQEQIVVPEGYELVDSVIYRPVATVDTTLVGKDVFLLMPSRDMGDPAWREFRLNAVAGTANALQ